MSHPINDVSISVELLCVGINKIFMGFLHTSSEI